MLHSEQTNSLRRYVTRNDPMFIVLNVGSGHNEVQERVTILKNILGEAGQKYEILIVDEAQALPAVARRAVTLAQGLHGVVVAAGGDGTISAVAREVLPSGCSFGVLPHGTFNLFSRAHGIPSDMSDAVHSLLQATAQPVQVGTVNQQPFLVNASLGLYARVFEDREYYKKKFGRSQIVALGAMLVTLLRAHQHFTLQLNSEDRTQELRTLSLVVGNNSLQLERIGVPDVHALQNSRLVAIAIRPATMLGLLRMAYYGALGKLWNAEHVTSFAFQQLTVNRKFLFRNRRLQVALDGELTSLSLPLVFEVSPHPLYLLVPPPQAS